MIYNYLKASIRNLCINWEISIINILGIVLSFAAVLLIATYVTHELNYDQFHKNNDNIYRVESKRFRHGELADNWASSPIALAPELKNSISGIADFVRLTVQRPQTERIVSRNETFYREMRVCFTEPSFFNIFSFELIKGEKESALTQPNSVVITEDMAHKYFGNENPIGKLLSFSTENNKSEYLVSGILKNLPENSHFKFDFFVSWSSLPIGFQNNWRIYGVYTYILTEQKVTPSNIINKYNQIAENYPPTNSAQNIKLELELQPITDIHFNAPKPYEIEAKGNKANMVILISIAIAILVISWINYINLFLSLVYKKLKEYMMRKIAGASFSSLATIFLSDVFIVYTLAVPLAVLFAYTALPFFNQITGLNLTLKPVTQPLFLVICSTYIVLASIFSCIVPAYIINKMKTSKWIRNKSNSANQGKVRQLLVITQFAASIILIAGTITVYKQLDFMRSQNLGYSCEQKMIIRNPAHTTDYGQKINSFKQEVRKITGVNSISTSGVIPGMEVANFLDLKRSDKTGEEAKYLEIYPIDHDFTKTYKMNIIAGKNLPENNARNKFLLNEEAVKLFGFTSNEDAIGRMLVFRNSPPMRIEGVVKNFHQQSLDKQFTPIAFTHNQTFGWLPQKYITIQLNASNLRGTMAQIDNTWNKFFKSSSYDYFFIDKYFNQQYKSNENFGIVFGVFTGLTIFIAALGLLGLALFAAQRRTKEIGIRKVNGAKISEILSMLNKDFLKWVAIAFGVACPIAYYAMSKWLANFAYKTELSWWIFALAGLIAMGIALLTVSIQSWRAATRNPVESLRYE